MTVSIARSVASDIETRPVAGALGAEPSGIHLGPTLDDEVIADIRDAILKHKVVFIRGQHHLDDATQAEFAQRLGSLTTAHPTMAGLDEHYSILPVDSSSGNYANSWHTDVTFVQRPPSFSLLRAVTLPPYGGDTSWANTVRAYETLPSVLRELAERLWAVHTNDYDYARSHAAATLSETTSRYREIFTSTIYQTEHPVVQVHPETGELALLLGHFAQRFLGLNGTDFRNIFETLQTHVTRLENTVRWRWASGDIAIWDNRSTQHYAVSDYGELPRRLHRVTVAGELPVSVDGAHSAARQGDATAYSPSTTAS